MKRTTKTLFLFYFLFANFYMFAQNPGDEDNNGPDGLEGGDPPAAEINTKLWILLLLALIYSYYTFRKRITINNQNTN